MEVVAPRVRPVAQATVQVTVQTAAQTTVRATVPAVERWDRWRHLLERGRGWLLHWFDVRWWRRGDLFGGGGG